MGKWDELYEEEYIVIDGDIYLVKYAKDNTKEYQKIGPAVRVKSIITKPDNTRVTEIEYKGNTFIPKSINSTLREIKSFTGRNIFSPKEMKAYLNHEVYNAQEKWLINSIGWDDNYLKFYHPSIQYEDVIYNIHNRESFVRKNCDIHHKFIKSQLEQGKVLGILYLMSVASLFLIEDVKPVSVFVPTTAEGELPVILAGNLFYDASNLIIPDNTTSFVMEKEISKLKNLPAIIRSANLKNIDLEFFIYMIASGQGKARASTRKIEVIILPLKSNVFFASGIPKTVKFTREGVMRRHIQFNTLTWNDLTNTSKSNAIQMIDAIGAGVDYIQYLIDNRKLLNYLNNTRKEVVPDGMAEFFFPIWAAFHLLQDYYGAQFTQLRKRLISLVHEKDREIK